jgi:hypothetical protein
MPEKLKTGLRITLLIALARRLSGGSQRFSDVDLALRQFGLQSGGYSDYQARPYEAVLSWLESGEDDKLLSLYEHLYERPFSRDLALQEAPGPWLPDKFRLFLSHVHTQKILMGHVKSHLLAYEIDGFVAHADIEPTKVWLGEIELALETCDALAAFLTADFHASNWTDHEVGYCIKRRILIIPVSLGVVPYGFMAQYQGLPAVNLDARQMAKRLCEVLAEHHLTSERMAPALVRRFLISNSYAAAEETVTLLEKVRGWTPDLLGKLEEAVQQNRQVRESHNVPERIHQLVERHRR